MKILIVPGLTLPEISEADVERVRIAGGGDTCEVIVADAQDALQYAPVVDVVLGFTPKSFLLQAPNLRWVHAISSGVDMFLYDEFKASDVVLTSEKAWSAAISRITGLVCC
ncbi:MAG: hypothetical protein O7H39_07670 [Gammaproteobacteria bacterium]|nr:hypothetical protein [Gammaproteobacteria bacterium]